MTQNFASIKGWGDKYEISDNGIVRNRLTKKILKTYTSFYQEQVYCNLSNQGETTIVTISELMKRYWPHIHIDRPLVAHRVMPRHTSHMT